MNKSEFIQQASIRLMVASKINVSISKEPYWERKNAAKFCVEDAESLWEELDKKGYTEEEEEEEDDCYINGNCDTP
jgi:hypothetical protein